MKAFCLLLCLALPRDIAGTIFPSQNKMDNPQVELLESRTDEIGAMSQQPNSGDQHNKQSQVYPRGLQNHHNNHHEQHHESHHQKHGHRDQRHQPYSYNSGESQQDSRPTRHNQKHQHFEQNVNHPQAFHAEEDVVYKPQAYKQDEQNAYNEQAYYSYDRDVNNPQAYQQDQQNQKPQSQQYGQQNKQPQDHVYKYRVLRYSDSYQSSDSNSQENTRENRETGNPEEDKKKYNEPLNPESIVNEHILKNPPVFGESVFYKGVLMAVNKNGSIKDRKDIEKIYKEAQKKVKHYTEEQKLELHQSIGPQTDNEDMFLNATQLLNKHKYEVEEYTVETDDGYYLTLFHIPPKRRARDVQKRPVVFLMHGLLGSADDWLLMGPDKSLAYLLADAGFDVYLGNARGNKYSRRHASKHPAQPDFWQFSNDEIALHDLPAMIDYALKQSNQDKLSYVGFSQGTTVFFALASSRPEYNAKINMMYALSPMAYMGHARSPLLRLIAPRSPLHDYMQEQLGHGEFKPSKELIQTLGGEMCEREIGCKEICSNVFFVMSSPNVENVLPKNIPVIKSHLPAGGSTKQMQHFGQAVASHKFRKFDYGATINKEMYGSTSPPSYDMRQVSAPVVLYYSERDWLSNSKDVSKLRRELPNVKGNYKMEKFNNLDFQFSEDAPEVMYKRLIESIQQSNSQ